MSLHPGKAFRVPPWHLPRTVFPLQTPELEWQHAHCLWMSISERKVLELLRSFQPVLLAHVLVALMLAAYRINVGVPVCLLSTICIHLHARLKLTNQSSPLPPLFLSPPSSLPSSPALPVLSNHDVLDSRKEKKKVYFGILSWISSWLQICEFRSTDAVNIINNFSNMHTRVSKRKYLHQLPCMIGFETLKIYFSLYLPNFSQFLYK